MAKKIAALLKQARTDAGLTQEQLAKKAGLTAREVGMAERGEKELTAEQLKAVAKATGVTQKSLLEAAGKASSGKTAYGKTSGKTESGKTASAKTEQMKLTAAEKKLVELYRKADSKTKTAAVKLLKESGTEAQLGALLSSLTGGGKDAISDLIGSAIGSLTGKKEK